MIFSHAIFLRMASDIQTQHPVFTKTPPAWHPYIKLARLDRPIGTWLLLFPCWWGIVLSAGGVVNMQGKDWLHAALFAAGALLMRSAGCVINDLWDRKLDAQVERTRTRPLAAGDISVKQAMLFLAGLLVPSLGILLTLPLFDIALGFVAAGLVVLYPLMKRVTWWPQLFLGFTFNWGALMGWAAQDGSLSLAVIVLYAGGILWTLAYDTVYAHQDKDDDALVGVRSTALLFGDKSVSYVSAFFAGAIFLWVTAKFMAAPSVITPILAIPVIVHAVWQIRMWRTDSKESSLAVFKSNKIMAALVFLMLAL